MKAEAENSNKPSGLEQISEQCNSRNIYWVSSMCQTVFELIVLVFIVIKEDDTWTECEESLFKALEKESNASFVWSGSALFTITSHHPPHLSIVGTAMQI